MKGDFSQLSFDHRKHYAGVLQQQGRVGTDSDWNEWVETVLRRFNVETRDIIGNCGRPKHHPGFEISVDTSTNPPDLLISDGRLYAGGMLAESESPERAGTKFSQQVDWPIPDKATWANLFPAGPAWPGLDFTTMIRRGTPFQLVYAEVWMRHLTALNDESARDQAFSDSGGHPDWTVRPEVGDLIRERALGGPDTCTRLQTVAQVKLWNYSDRKIQTCDQACAALAQALPPKTIGTMRLDVTPTPPVTDPCQEPLQGGYGGAWNRMYRVEIHDEGAVGTATFKWSNENGAFTVRIKGNALTPVPAGTDIIITSIGDDQETQLTANDWVEVCGEETELGVFRNALAQVKSTPVANTDGTWAIQLTGAVVLPRAPFLRRWSDDTQTIRLKRKFNLDAGSGLGVTFFGKGGSTGGTTYFHAQDYWTWAARVDIRAVEPQTLAEVPQPPRGIERHYCCLALLTWQNQRGTIVNTANTMCTPVFPPLTEIPTNECGCCCAISVGDGVLSHGDYDSIAEAFASLPDTGQRGAVIVCIQEGVHRIVDPIRITQDRVIIRGCGPNTFLEAPDGAFLVDSRRQIVFADLVIESEVTAIMARNVHEFTIRDSRIRMSVSKPEPPPVIELEAVAEESARILSRPALVLQGWKINILRNDIRGSFTGGGIALAPACGYVTIANNNIHKSALAGIDFSYAFSAGPTKWLPMRLGVFGSAFEFIDIVDNTFDQINAPAIRQLPTLAGISLADIAFLEPKNSPSLLVLRDPAGPIIANLSIMRNLITHCGTGSTTDLPGESSSSQKTAAKLAAAQQLRSPQPEAAIQLYAVEDLEISGNRIVRNGERSSVYAAVLVQLSEGATFRQNFISGNGTSDKTPDFDSGGILLQLALPGVTKSRSKAAFGVAGLPALIVEDNLIESPNGAALKVVGLGSIQVLRNVLTNRRTSSGVSSSCLVILNMGYTEESLLPVWLTGNFLQVGANSPLLPPSLLTRAGGLTQISENQIVTTSETKSAGFAAFVTSADDLSFTNNQVRVNSDVEMTSNTIASAFTLRVVGNRFSEPLSHSSISCHGVGGMVTGTSNQGTHCLLFKGNYSTAEGMNLVHPLFAPYCEKLSEGLLSPSSASGRLAQSLRKISAAQLQMASLQLSALGDTQNMLSQRAEELGRLTKAMPELKDRVRFYLEASTCVKEMKGAVSGAPKPVKGAFILHGRILSTDGKPLSELSVSLSDPNGVTSNRIKPVNTDRNGYFTVTVRAAEFPELKAGAKLFVSVMDGKRKEVAKPEQPAVFQPGAVAIMPIAG